MSNSKLLSIIIVTYNDAHHLEQSVASVYQKIGNLYDWEIIIVNNDTRQNIAGLPLDFSRIKIINNLENGGFGQGNNVGAKEALGKYLLFLNPDTEILDDSFQKILNLIERDESIGAIGVRLLDNDKKIQEWSAGKKVTFWNILENNLRPAVSRAVWESEKNTEVDWVTGAVLIIPRELFLEIGGFDKDIFMYFEDVDICERIKNEGKKVIYFPEVEILHKCGGSYTDERKKRQKKEYYDSMEYYFNKHRPKWEYLTIKILRKVFYS